MSVIQSASFEFLWAVIHKSSEQDHSIPTDFTNTKIKSGKFSDGAGAQKSEQHWHDRRSIADAANDDLDLAGVLTNRFGDTVTFTKLKAIAVANRDTITHLDVGGAAANPITSIFAGTGTSKVRIPPAVSADNPSIWAMWATDADGWAVTAGSADTLRIAHGGVGTVAASYDIFILGEES